MHAKPHTHAVIFLHPGCNMTCTFCITDDATDTLTFERAQAVLGEIRGRGIRSIVLGGGEPFAWPNNVVALAAWAKAQGFFVQIGTNGVAIPSDFGGDAFDRFVLPLDSADPEVHNASRQLRTGHHQLIVKRLEALRADRRSVTVSTVVTSRNIDGLTDLGDCLARYAASGGLLHAWHLYKFIPQGRGGCAHAADLDISDADYDAACDRAKARPASYHIYKRRDMRHSRTVDFYWMQNDRLHVGSEVW